MDQFYDQFYFQFYPVLSSGASLHPPHVVAGGAGPPLRALDHRARGVFQTAAEISVALEQDPFSRPRRPADLPSCRRAEVPTCHLPTCWQVTSRAQKTPQPWFTGARHENLLGPRSCPSAALQQNCEACQTARNNVLSGCPSRSGKFHTDQRASGESRLRAHEPGRLFHRFGHLVCRPRPLGNPILDLVNRPAFY